MFKKITAITLLIFVLNGCTKDDLCPEGTATTPNLIIVFRDIANPLLRKNVNVLSVLTDNIDSTEVVRYANTDSIVIPLDTNTDVTRYLFKKSIISGADTLNNIDKIEFTYFRNNGYVNRACGFKTEFENLEAVLEDEGNENWIQQLTIRRENINDEDSSHITVLH